MKLIPATITRGLARKAFQVKRQSPHIFFAGGVAGVITATVLACRATLKLEEVVDELQNDLENVKKPILTKTYTEQDRYKDLGYVYGKNAVAMVKLYGPSIAVGTISIVALTGSHIQLTRRNTALTVALAGVSKALDEYRERVRAELGENREKEIFTNVEVVKRKDGTKDLRPINDKHGPSQYARFFDETSTEWFKDPEMNRVFVLAQQNYANNLLYAKGFLFLNDVYRSLGMEETRAGQFVGWMAGGEGDNYVDFGVFKEDNNRFINNFERSILLDFNVDGVICDLI